MANEQDRELNWIAEREHFKKMCLTLSLTFLVQAELSYPKTIYLWTRR